MLVARYVESSLRRPTCCGITYVQVQSERHVVEKSLEQMAAEAAERMVESRLSVLEQQVLP